MPLARAAETIRLTLQNHPRFILRVSGVIP